MGRARNRIVFAGGGTGGHLFPALAVAHELRRRRSTAEIVFIGSRRGLERELVPRAGYPVKLLRLSGLKGQGAFQRALAALAAAWAVVHCAAWMLGARPDLVVGVGGYASGPAVLAARLLRVPTMILEQNHFPGATNRWLASWVDVVCVPSEAARERLGGRGVVTGNPVRDELRAVGPPPAGERLSLLVFGGSRGARSINRAMAGSLGGLERIVPPPRVVHQTGTADEAELRAAARAYPEGLYEVRAFLDDMPARLSAADLVVCRAGATTLAELAVTGRPAILVPYPHAADDHQRHNAETVASAGAALVIPDSELDPARLVGAVSELAADPARRERMSRAARTLARPDSASTIADLAESLLDRRTRRAARVS